ncbi:MAG: Gfo/Idh/MocA family oxidoreductase [Bacteroidetes bacterium]|jgi:predicted dehydrogenase|nr:Gfo/Idh/MocA family oxidoreductase [Bacteroidota bacterium]
MKVFKAVGIGAGYFAAFQYRAWSRIPEVQVTAMCNRNKENAEPIMKECGIQNHYTDYREMLEKEKPDFVDIITPPGTHLEMCQFAAERGIHIICQKPLAPNLSEAEEIIKIATDQNVRFMVHENWRFQPWYREIKKLFQAKTIGHIHTLNFRSRMGDGWGENAYIPRQPYFREYPRFLVYENGIHFIDTYRYLLGEVESVYARLRQLNPVIKGEDCGQVLFNFAKGQVGFWDANRYNEPNYPSPRYTFGELLAEGTEGSIRLYGDGRLTIHPLGMEETNHDYHHENVEFAGDCVYITQRHFIDCMLSGQEFEVNGSEYLKSLKVQEAVYQSAESGKPEYV